MPLGANAPATSAELDSLSDLIDAWLKTQLAENPIVIAVDRDTELRRWYVRMRGEEREFVVVWLTLGEYTLVHEVYFMPYPEENRETAFEFLLRCNPRMYGMAFAIGDEDAVYLTGRTPLSALDVAELDRVIGSSYAYVEQWWRPAMRIAFESRFEG